MKSFQNLILLQNLYRMRELGFEYSDPFSINEKSLQTIPMTIEQLSQNISTCHLCDLSKSRTQSMSGYGNPHANLMIIDFSVSANEDETNSYYAGRSGETLKNMVQNVLKLSVDDVYFTHAIKCKPLNSNMPSDSEWESCQSHLFSQMEFVKPKVVVTLGEYSYAKVTGENENFQSVRGHVIDFKKYKLIPIDHPQFLLRNPELKKIALNDLKTIKSCL
ncbi:MAG: uracil-DNA glycosylase [Epsilonproteobacteria bacterium]|nr:uracil-DNA glycosylase [Campylobacterota bacterium]OIO14779.1 MAG: uracil-DNA glycosylase [Helicobacteraceae bacterium CG1_02_36_14]PIP09269.1 MAG: uracil-DNA glycosylase [Sulfurimonas sp. CG23_combo_of_CG06-09_8_20_14_all_36_33]PIS25743.1 MAG: uracil-DNA glycosylase [Sulfurimonas sp. CG08_land_8_20_14_0_20_36_33]PIU34591.1 MAG: uracil-DNA glycosylase [Sulfurimonas sp. CG07_land_8_20_14_0_80_36_56]PIV04800.1 MAG: uracil-DNA glycosylase [Sulfurimonas sp. CG03_land_8_20_14_0_80_36_25]PIV3628